jgi:hypothetical protein
MKFVITGYPKTGKTTLAKKFKDAGYEVLHTDDAIELGIHNDSEAVSQWFDKPGNWVVEGVTAPRAIRKWLAAHPGEDFPADAVVYMKDHVVPWENKGSFVKGIDTVWSQVADSVKQGDRVLLDSALEFPPEGSL